MITPGTVYNDIEVIGFSHRTGDKHYRYYYQCRCLKCNKTFITREDSIKSGHVKSCGCLKLDIASQRFTVHGMTNTHFYQAWQNMKARCFNSNAPYAINYSERGITLEDKRWLDFQHFHEDMYESYLQHFKEHKGDTTLDRTDVNKGYCKSNCHWATHQQQDNNKTCTHWVSFNGKTQSISDWAKELKISYEVLLSRIKRGWSIEKAMTTKTLTKKEQNLKPVICLETGKIYACANDAAVDNAIPLQTVRKIISRVTKNPRCGKHFQYYEKE